MLSYIIRSPIWALATPSHIFRYDARPYLYETGTLVMTPTCCVAYLYVPIFCTRKVSFHLLGYIGTSFWLGDNIQRCNGEPLKLTTCYKDHLVSPYCPKDQSYKLPFFRARMHAIIKLNQEVVSSTRNGSLRVLCPIGECEEDSSRSGSVSWRGKKRNIAIMNLLMFFFQFWPVGILMGVGPNEGSM